MRCFVSRRPPQSEPRARAGGTVHAVLRGHRVNHEKPVFSSPPVPTFRGKGPLLFPLSPQSRGEGWGEGVVTSSPSLVPHPLFSHRDTSRCVSSRPHTPS